ncbi:hypothetical protein KCP73_07600 [Salmonella enterica subsp. enterica]|nr:hypothetical protein KCP73_07600 [Salmonella enterica subsp. enterica]
MVSSLTGALENLRLCRRIFIYLPFLDDDDGTASQRGFILAVSYHAGDDRASKRRV